MNHGPTAAHAFIADFTTRWSPRSDRTLIFCPPSISLTTVTAALSSRRDLGVGVQNIWTEDKGAFTGETSASMARDAGASFALVGHSERRHVFGETDEQTALKCAAAVRNGLVPILCVGELLAQREAGKTETVVLSQLEAGLSKLNAASIKTMAVAYEPVWAIGTGKSASPNDASVVHREIRGLLRAKVGDAAETVPILYGGSVNMGNVASLLAAEEVDGLLVGGASLVAEDWARICST